MTSAEKILYHQIHPFKLGTDWSAGMLALYLLWQRRLWLALAAMFVPSSVVSFILIRFVDLEPYKASRFGHYVRRYMTPAMQRVRLLGVVPMAAGAWYHRFWLIPLGISITLLGWLRGVIWPTESLK